MFFLKKPHNHTIHLLGQLALFHLTLYHRTSTSDHGPLERLVVLLHRNVPSFTTAPTPSLFRAFMVLHEHPGHYNAQPQEWARQCCLRTCRPACSVSATNHTASTTPPARRNRACSVFVHLLRKKSSLYFPSIFISVLFLKLSTFSCLLVSSVNILFFPLPIFYCTWLLILMIETINIYSQFSCDYTCQYFLLWQCLCRDPDYENALQYSLLVLLSLYFYV